MIPVHHFMTHALAAVVRKAPLTADKVAFAWRTAVGPAVDRVSAVELRDSTLHVTTRDATWQREIERSAGLVRTRLNALLGTGVVTWITVTSTDEGER